MVPIVTIPESKNKPTPAVPSVPILLRPVEVTTTASDMIGVNPTSFRSDTEPVVAEKREGFTILRLSIKVTPAVITGRGSSITTSIRFADRSRVGPVMRFGIVAELVLR